MTFATLQTMQSEMDRLTKQMASSKLTVALKWYQRLVTAPRATIRITLSDGSTISSNGLLTSDDPKYRHAREEYIRKAAWQANMDPAYFLKVVNTALDLQWKRNDDRIAELARIRDTKPTKAA